MSTSTDAAAKTKLSPKRRQALEAEFKRVAGKADGLVTLEAFLGTGEVAELLQEKLLVRAEVRGVRVFDHHRHESIDLSIYMLSLT